MPLFVPGIKYEAPIAPRVKAEIMMSFFKSKVYTLSEYRLIIIGKKKTKNTILFIGFYWRADTVYYPAVFAGIVCGW
jgi:hypothetical protein